MPRDRQVMEEPCPGCQTGQISCTVNIYHGDEEWIVSWEHRCRDCSHRDTRAYRSTDDPVEPESVTRVCPFCQRTVTESTTS